MFYRNLRKRTPFVVCAFAFSAVTGMGCGGGGGSSSSSLAPQQTQAAAFRSVATAAEGFNNYNFFESQVIHSQAELDGFLKIASEQPGSQEDPFFQAIRAANLNFDQESLVLIQNLEPSGGQASFDTPQLQGEALTSTLHIALYPAGTAVVRTYASALAVSKARVHEVNVTVVDSSGYYKQPIKNIHLTVGD